MKTNKIICSILLASTMMLTSQTGLTAPVGEQAISFEERGGQTVDAFEGSIMVPENRSKPDSRKIPLKYVRFPATTENPGPPIIYLAGGPGGSGIRTARDRRFAMFMALRAHGDVIALDQRGTGASDILPQCTSNHSVPNEKRISDTEFVKINQAAFEECMAFWREEGIEIEGYNTIENARDLDDLRKHLGAEKVVLWGISYGSHLAFAALKEMEDRIEKVVIASAEGLDQTVKQPARTDDYFNRLQAAVDTQPGAKAAYGDIKSLMRRVHAKLEQEPVLLNVPLREGGTAPYMFHRRDMQQIASAFVSDPARAGALLSLYLALDAGVTDPIAGLVGRFIVPGEPISFRAMSTAMDVASGMTKTKADLIESQAETALLKNYLNFSYHYDGLAPELDLGDAFRAKPKSDVPVLLFSGTLDGRTYVESQLEAVSGLSNLTAVTVQNAGHNLFMLSDEVQQTIDLFLRGAPVETTKITVELPDLSPRR